MQAQSSSNRGGGGGGTADFRQQQILFLRGQSAEAPKFVPLQADHPGSPPQRQTGYYNSQKPSGYVRRGGYFQGRPSWEQGFNTRYYRGPKSGWEQPHARSHNSQNQCNSWVDSDANRLSSDFHVLSLENSSSGISGSKVFSSHHSGRYSLQLTPDIQKKVLNSLASLQPGETIQTRVLAKRLRLPKKIVNKALYSLSKLNQAVRIEGTPPLWRLYKEGDTEYSHGRTQFSANSPKNFAQNKVLNHNQGFSEEVKPDGNLTSTTSTATEASSDSSEDSEDSEKESSTEVQDSDQAVDTFSPTEKKSGLPTTMDKDSKEHILQYLHETGQANALMIAKNLGLRNAKQVNPTLYAMEKHGELSRNSSSVTPVWELSAHQREKMGRQRKAAAAASMIHVNSEFCGASGPVKEQTSTKMVCGSMLLQEVMNWENIPTSQTCDSKDSLFGNGMLEKQSHSDLDTLIVLEKTPSDDDLISVPYSSQNATYYQKDDKNGGLLEWASDDIPEFLNTIRSEVAVSLAAPLPSAQNTESTRLQRLKLALSKNPVSGLMEYAQFLGYSCEFLLLEQSGPSHNPRLAGMEILLLFRSVFIYFQFVVI